MHSIALSRSEWEELYAANVESPPDGYVRASEAFPDIKRSAANSRMHILCGKGLVDCVTIGCTKYYKIKAKS